MHHIFSNIKLRKHRPAWFRFLDEINPGILFCLSSSSSTARAAELNPSAAESMCSALKQPQKKNGRKAVLETNLDYCNVEYPKPLQMASTGVPALQSGQLSEG